MSDGKPATYASREFSRGYYKGVSDCAGWLAALLAETEAP